MDNDARLELLYKIIGYWTSQAISAAPRLQIADHLQHGPKCTDELASKLSAHPLNLYRLLRALASQGIFKELSGRRFELTAMAERLSLSHPESLYGLAVMNGSDWHWQPWGSLFKSIKTGKTAFDHCHGERMFDYLDGHPENSNV